MEDKKDNIVKKDNLHFLQDKLTKEDIEEYNKNVESYLRSPNKKEDWEELMNHCLIPNSISKKECIEIVKRAQEEEREKIFKRVSNLISKISTYKSEIDCLVNIGRQNALADFENEFEEIKKGRKDYKDNRNLDKIAEDLNNKWENNKDSIFDTKKIILEGMKIAKEQEREKWKLKISELRNDLYDGLPVGEIKDAFEMIKITNKHMKELDKLVEGGKNDI